MQNSRLVDLAIKGLEAEKAKIEQELAELRNHSTAGTRTSRTLAPTQPQTVTPPAKAKRKMSDSGTPIPPTSPAEGYP